MKEPFWHFVGDIQEGHLDRSCKGVVLMPVNASNKLRRRKSSLRYPPLQNGFHILAPQFIFN